MVVPVSMELEASIVILVSFWLSFLHIFSCFHGIGGVDSNISKFLVIFSTHFYPLQDCTNHPYNFSDSSTHYIAVAYPGGGGVGVPFGTKLNLF